MRNPPKKTTARYEDVDYRGSRLKGDRYLAKRNGKWKFFDAQIHRWREKKRRLARESADSAKLSVDASDQELKERMRKLFD